MNSAAVRHFRQKLSRNQPVYGLWVTLEAPSITEMAVALGLDWVVIDAEHGHLDWKEIVEHLRGAVRSHTVVLVRLSENSESLIKRALDIGADGVVIPWMETVEGLEKALRSCRYPPAGRRGIGAERATCWGTCFVEHVKEAEEDVLLVPLIESVAGAKEAANLAKVDGVDTFFFGPADLSATAGHAGQWEGDGVGELIKNAREAIRAAGKHCGIVARNDGELKSRPAEGFNMVGLGLDAGLLLRTLHTSLQSIQRDRPITPGFTLENDAASVAAEVPVACAPDSFRPDRPEVMNPLGTGPQLEIAPGVHFDAHVGKHNNAVDLTTGLVTFAPGAVLPYHRHKFDETITLLKGSAMVEVEGRIYHLSPLDNVSIPAGLAHKAVNLSRTGESLLHIAMNSCSPDRELVESFFSKRAMPQESATWPGGERFTHYASSELYEPGPSASFVDYFNDEILPGFGLSGGHGRFKPGGRLPAHLHDFDESITIVDGVATCMVEGRRYVMDDMATALQPRGRIHYFINESDAPMEMIWVYAGPMPERIVVDESCATVLNHAW